MFIIIGFLVVIGSIIGGYLMEHGHLAVLLQPAELVIIGGSALGTLLIANPLRILKQLVSMFPGALKGSKHDKKFYLENLKMLNDIFVYARRNGMAKLESDLDDPKQSQLFQQFPKFLADQAALDFFCDTLRMSISGGVSPFELDQLMESDIEVQHHEMEIPVTALTTVADSLPGLGIVAAVLGVVITMGALGGPPEEIGHKVAAALVGTFLGILLCYGFAGPLASNLAKINDDHTLYMQFLRTAILASVRGLAPQLVVEAGRRVIPVHARPSFKDSETTIKGSSGPAAAAA